MIKKNMHVTNTYWILVRYLNIIIVIIINREVNDNKKHYKT